MRIKSFWLPGWVVARVSMVRWFASMKCSTFWQYGHDFL